VELCPAISQTPSQPCTERLAWSLSRDRGFMARHGRRETRLGHWSRPTSCALAHKRRLNRAREKMEKKAMRKCAGCGQQCGERHCMTEGELEQHRPDINRERAAAAQTGSWLPRHRAGRYPQRLAWTKAHSAREDVGEAVVYVLEARVLVRPHRDGGPWAERGAHSVAGAPAAGAVDRGMAISVLRHVQRTGGRRARERTPALRLCLFFGGGGGRRVLGEPGGCRCLKMAASFEGWRGRDSMRRPAHGRRQQQQRQQQQQYCCSGGRVWDMHASTWLFAQ
jgi:hypothetical protein